MTRLLVLAVCLAACGVGIAPADAQQKEVWKEMDVPAAPTLTPEQAMKAFKIAPGFRIEMVAAEPLVEDPVAMDWDAAGRLYVVEMRGYMPDDRGKGEDARVGQIVRLEDTDGDGRMDKSVVFLDKLQMPRAVAVLGDGAVLVGEPPNLWYCKDTDGDGKCDEKRAIYTSYGRQGPVEHTDNGLLQALDNWIYNAKSDKRFRIRGGKLVVDKTRFRGQWGIAQDNYGRLYYNSNSDYLRVDLIPSEYLDRNPHFSSNVGQNHGVVRDQATWSIRVNPGINRGYQPHMLRKDGRLARTTAISGQAIYRGDQFGDDYIGDAFIPEPAGNLVAHFDIVEKDGKLTGTQTTTPDAKWEKRAFLASTDERFRPVSAYNGPDGAVYIVDLYRGILQHKVYVTDFLRKQILERGLDEPVGMGRIYRIVKDDRPIDRTTPDLAKLPSDKLAAYLADANGWTRDMAQRVLVERNDEASLVPIRKLVMDSANPLGQIHGIWTLAGMKAIAPTDALALMKDAEPRVSIAALHAATPVAIHRHANNSEWGKFTAIDGPVFAAAGGDPNYALTSHAVASVGRFAATVDARDTRVADALLERVGANLKSSAVRDVFLNAVHGREFAIASSEHGRNNVDLLRSIGRMVMSRGDASEIETLIKLADDSSKIGAIAILEGMTSWTKKPKPRRLAKRPEALAMLVNYDDQKLSSLAAALDEKWLVYGVGDDAPAKLTPAEQKLFNVGKQHYTLICAACHQPHGKGQAGLAPPLVDSEWVTGDPKIATKIVLHGMMGPVKVNKQEWNLVMPGHIFNPMFTDDVTAGVLTYIRREWGHDADPVSPDLVKTIRAATKGRVEPWTVKELMAK